MLNLFLSAGVAYLIGSGTVASAAVVGHGLVRAARAALDGDGHGAAIEALGGLAAPTALAYGALAGLCGEVVNAANDLVAPPLDQIDQELARAA
ncbi:MAG: hypothetical protein FJ304_15550 [Planctomycetes bacterium]|nr:hypothetical protein [Planctomycetota bacterium]